MIYIYMVDHKKNPKSHFKKMGFFVKYFFQFYSKYALYFTKRRFKENMLNISSIDLLKYKIKKKEVKLKLYLFMPLKLTQMNICLENWYIVAQLQNY